MPVQEGSKAVTDCLTGNNTKKPDIPGVLHPLRTQVNARAASFADCYLSCRDSTGQSCLFYGPCNHESEIWHVGLMFVEYVARLLLNKARIGHCYAQNRTNPVCSFSRDMHLKMLKAIRNDLCKLAKEIEDLENAEKATWPKADPHPTPP